MKYKKPKPKIYLDDTNLPAIKDWKVGEIYNIQAKVKLMFQSEGEEYEGEFGSNGSEKQPMKATFKILSIIPIKEKKTNKKKSDTMLSRVKRYE